MIHLSAIKYYYPIPLPNDEILDKSKLKAYICRRQNKSNFNVEIYFGKGRKHSGKRSILGTEDVYR